MPGKNLKTEKYDTVVFGLFETGLGVIRSLGQNGLRVIGVDFKRNIGIMSKYARSIKCPHPLQKESEFIDWVRSNFSDNHPLPVFITQDDFLSVFSRNRKTLSEYFVFNMIDHSLLESIADKYQQNTLAVKAGIETPNTWLINEPSDLMLIQDDIGYPVIIKGRDVNSWRNEISRSIKVYLANDLNQLTSILQLILEKGISVIVQEVIPGPDTNHYKYCSYTSEDGKILAEFTIRKIRQNPVRFGVGSVVESVYNSELIELGRKLFSKIGYIGIGSIEFKQDQSDGIIKLIEINPRYWQQNSLATECGINFPYINYLDLLNRNQDSVKDFKPGIKWINILMDFDSFLTYRKEGNLSYKDWRNSLKGEKIYSDFTWDDPLPRLYQFGFGPNFHKIPKHIIKKLRK
jgi:D-aspartate ligase